jgi:hypothetical protein
VRVLVRVLVVWWWWGGGAAGTGALHL